MKLRAITIALLYTACAVIAYETRLEPDGDVQPGNSYVGVSNNVYCVTNTSWTATRGNLTLTNKATLFVDSANGDWRLKAGSGAIGVGQVFSSEFTDDILGTVRGAAWDVGAYEYAAPAGTFTRSLRFGPQTSTGKVVWQ